MGLLNYVKDGFADAFVLTLAMVAFVVYGGTLLKDLLSFRRAASPTKE